MGSLLVGRIKRSPEALLKRSCRCDGYTIQYSRTSHRLFQVLTASGRLAKAGPTTTYGGLAQLGERLPCTQEVIGSSPLSSTTEKRSPSGNTGALHFCLDWSNQTLNPQHFSSHGIYNSIDYCIYMFDN